ncbi:MAG: MarR family winged helix-turn-helix transcriptional regulator [Candidatus Thiodiazotropha sp. (ex Lucinoma borealis)]|nr:MarR family winged helix-turn-helix transcriptional regulator [Candidatus Thiodiazotropha sp. (ex Lucinoma borealis)]
MSKKYNDSSGSGITPLDSVEYGAELTRLFSEKYGGQTTVNQLRVIHSVLTCLFRNGPDHRCTTKWIHDDTGIPLSTISRAVAGLVENGWLAEVPHPEDGRSRIVGLGPKSDRTPADIRFLGDWMLKRSK